MNDSSYPSHLRIITGLALCAFAYLYPFPYQARLNNPNENVRFYMTAALVENGTYAIDAMRERWGWVNDAAVSGGHVYSVKAPGTSFLGIPGYAIYLFVAQNLGWQFDRIEALWACRLTATILPTLIWLYLFFLWLCRRSRDPFIRDAVFISVALGSFLYGYGLIFVSHTVSAAAAFGAFMLLYQQHPYADTKRHYSHAFLAGLLTAGVTLFEYPGLFCSVLLAFYGFWVIRPFTRLLAFCVGGFLPTLVMAHFQWRAFGNPFTPGHMMVETEALRVAHHRGFFGAEGPSWQALYGLLFDPGAGLLPLTPILAFALIGFIPLLVDRRSRFATTFAALIVSVTIAAICSMNNWRGGWTIGPRYLALVVPFLAWAAVEGLQWLASRVPMLAYAIALGSTAVGLLASGLPSAYYPHLPPEITRPLPQLFRVLVAHHYAPFNAGSVINLYGTASMIPLFAVGALALTWCVSSILDRAKALKLCVGSIAVFVVLTFPLVKSPDEDPAVSRAVAFITRRWTPDGHDMASSLITQLNASAGKNSELVARLVEIYREEGRYQEAAAVLRYRRAKTRRVK
jgi:hypothetical protein